MDGRIEHFAFILQFALHYGGHFLVPFLIAWVIWRAEWKKFGAVMVAANLIDIDHLWAVPIYDPERCSIGYHTFHGWEAGLIYLMLLLIPRWWTRALGAGAIWHLAVDAADCMAMNGQLL